jgi:peptide/nickel transport system permease protein
MMIVYIVRRLLGIIPMLFLVSILTFVIIQLPPGDFMTSLQAQVSSSGSGADTAAMDNLRHLYGLDEPITCNT